MRPSCTAPARSAASCTCTSARRRSRSARCMRCAPEDNVVATYREHGHALVRGVAMNAIMAEMFGKQEGCSRGRGGSMHLFDAPPRFYGGNAIVGGGLPLAVGLALADKMQQASARDRLLLRRGRGGRGRVPRIDEPGRAVAAAGAVLCENNLYAMGTALARSESQTDLCAKAASYGMATAQGRRHGRAGGARGGARRRAQHVRERRRAVLPRMPDLPLPRPLDVRPRAVPRQGGGRSSGSSAGRSTPSRRA